MKREVLFLLICTFFGVSAFAVGVVTPFEPEAETGSYAGQALDTLGIDVSALVTGLGLTGFALSFAFKDMLSSFISGIWMFLYTSAHIWSVIRMFL